METIGLIAAMPQESDALLRLIPEKQPAWTAGLRGYRFELFGRQCLLVESGIGLERAAQATRALIAAAHPHLLVSFGIAGATDSDLEIGDVVIAACSYLLEGDLAGQPRPLASLSAEAWHSATDLLGRRGAEVFHGVAISTRGSQLILPAGETLEHPVLEMETAAVAQAAYQANLPLLAIRSISDGPQAPLPFDLQAITGDDYQLRKAELIKTLLRRPQILLQAPGMLQNMGMAAEHAAIAVIAILGQPAPLISG